MDRDGDPLIGLTLSHYRIVEKLGGGGMGVVYKAEDTRLRRPVALKFISEDLASDTGALSRFQREARTASALNHPHICTIYDIGEQDGHAFIAMEYLEGTTLKDRLDAGPIGPEAALRLGAQIADALDAAHSANVVHRDIKPANIFITPRGHAKLLDFGLAKQHSRGSHDADLTTAAGTMQGVVMGTLAYMAPEQALGEPVDHRADLWSVGLVLYEMVKGVRPAPAIRLRVEGSPELERIISKCLETDRELRYQHASDLRADLERLTRGTDSAVTGRDWPAVKARARWAALAGGAGIALAAVGYIAYPRATALTDKDTIVLGDFTNTTGDAVFDHTLRQGLTVQLQQSPFLSLISDDRVSRTLALMQQPPNARLTPDIAHGVCVRTASAAVLEGSIATLGSTYVLGLRAKSCTTGDILADDQAQATRKEDVLNTLGQMATRFRTDVGESLATIEQHSTPLAEATTTSLEALAAYSAGMRAISDGWAQRLPLYQRAAVLDPNFAMAHARVGFGHSTLGESALARASIRRAYELRDRVSDAERFFIETLYDRDVTGNLEREQQTLETWAQSYPRDAMPHGLLGGLAASSTGKSEMAIAEAAKAIALDPDLPPSYSNKAFHQVLLNRLDDALVTVGDAKQRNLDFDNMLLAPYFVAFLRGNDDAIRQAADAARKNRSTEDMISHLESLALARAGRLQEARRLSALTIQAVERSGRRERAGLFEAGRAVWEAFYGNHAAARQSAARALEFGRGGREVNYAAAFALALAGDRATSRALAGDLAREYPEDTSVQFLYLPTLRALFALEAGDAPAAIAALQSSSRYDLALGAVGFIGRFGGLYPIYVRGQAYLAAGQSADAVSEFQRIVDHPSITLVDPMGALARLQLARALARSGDTTKAKSAYGELLMLWKDADPDIPLVKQAVAELARLP
jgi:eukaryotic-like serine/threonine-protein kinase